MATDFWLFVSKAWSHVWCGLHGTKVMNALRAEHAVDLYRYKAKIGWGSAGK